MLLNNIRYRRHGKVMNKNNNKYLSFSSLKRLILECDKSSSKNNGFEGYPRQNRAKIVQKPEYPRQKIHK